jgi:hypothetical protein
VVFTFAMWNRSAGLRNESGQVIALVALSMTVLVGIAALVVDLGFAYAAQRNLQSSADEAALAGAQGLPSLGSAMTYAQQYGSNGKNAHPGFGNVDETVSTTCVDGTPDCSDDAVVVDEVSHPQSFFAQIFGAHLFTITVRAVACRDSISGAVQLVSDTYDGPNCAAPPTSSPVTGVTNSTTTTTTPTAPTTTTLPAVTTTTPAVTTTPTTTTLPVVTTPTTTTIPALPPPPPTTTTTTPVVTTTPTTTTTPVIPGVNSPTLSTKLSTSPVTTGTSVNDTATLTGATSDAGGTVSYTVFSDAGCSQNPVTAGTVTVSHGLVPNSNALSFANPGTFYWQASYSGDAKNRPALSACTSEPLPVYGECALGYPDTSSTLSSTVFNESATLRAYAPEIAGPGGTIKVWYNDEHAMTLGVREVDVTKLVTTRVKSGRTYKTVTTKQTTTTDYPVSALTTDPEAVTSPAVGATMAQGGLDVSDRPMFPALFITDITNNPAARNGDWQQGSTAAIPPNAVFGSWKAAVETVDDTTSPPTVSVTPDSDPAKNNWSLGKGADTPPGGFTSLDNEGYGAEARWNVDSLGLQPGHAYRMEFMVHDGDQLKVGGDTGEACMTVVMPS